MGSYLFNYSVATDIWQLAYRPEDDYPGMVSDASISDGELVPAGSWTAFVSPYQVNANSGIGVTLLLESGEVLEFLAHALPPTDTDGTTFVLHPGRTITMRVEHEEGILTYSWSENQTDWTEVASFSPASPVSEVGIVLRYDHPGYPAGGLLGAVRILQGVWQNVAEEVWIEEPSVAPTSRDVPPQATVTSTSEPLVHVIVGAQFGDLEFDVGKSVRWVTWFCDNVFVLDVNLGTPRYWIVNWAETFPDAEHTVTGINYFVRPAEFRAEQWKQYRTAFGDPANDDWFLFLDAHEGLSLDNRSLPDDYDFAPFKSFLWREIQRAQDAGQNFAVLPYYVFLRSDHITNVTYGPSVQGVDPIVQALSVPYYLPYQGQKRLWNAAALKAANFDWSQIDTPVAPSANAKAQILSYGYAHWNLQDIEPPQTTVPALTAANDDGWRMRNLLSKVRPIPGLPTGDTWVPPSSDPAGIPGPWAPADANNPDPIRYTGPYLNPKVGTVSTPDPGVTPSRMLFRFRARRATHTAVQAICSQWPGATSNRGWMLRQQVDGSWAWVSSADGATAGATRTVIATPPTADPEVWAIGIRPDNGAGQILVNSWKSTDGGATFTQIGSQFYPKETAVFESTYVVRIGASGNWPSSAENAWQGEIYWAEMIAGVTDPRDKGTLVWRFDASEYPGTGGPSYVDPRGRTWSLTSAAAIVPSTAEIMPQPVPADPSLLGVVIPLYDCVFRLNMRDGVWYEENKSGNIPLKWDEPSQTWTTDYDPAEWAKHGVKSYDPSAVPTP